VPSSLLISAPLLCASSSSKVVTLCNTKGGGLCHLGHTSITTGIPTRHHLLYATPLCGPILICAPLWHNIHSALPLGVVSFLFILDLTPHRVPLANYFPPFSSLFFLSQLFLCTSWTLFLLLLFWVHSIPHLISTTSWILLNGSIFWLLFPHLFQTPPPSTRGFTRPFYRAPCASFFSLRTTS
jgi:hypothetical protein